MAEVTLPLPVTERAAAAGDRVVVGRARLGPGEGEARVGRGGGLTSGLVRRDRVAAGRDVSSVAVAVAAVPTLPAASVKVTL